MSDLNCVALVGRLGRDPEVRQVNEQSKVCRIRIAVDTGFGDRKSTAWVDVEFWQARGEALAAHFEKGKAIGIVGELRMDEWQAEDGSKRSKLFVRGIDWSFLPGGSAQQGGRIGSGGGQRGAYQAPQPATGGQVYGQPGGGGGGQVYGGQAYNDDLPF